jgi:hypothetical protein
MEVLMNKTSNDQPVSEDPNLMRSHIKIFLKSSKNLLTIHVEDIKLLVHAILNYVHLSKKRLNVEIKNF